MKLIIKTAKMKLPLHEFSFVKATAPYCKLAQNSTAAETIIENIRKNKPSDGLVQVLKITEKQFSKIEYIVGSSKSEVYDGDERLIIL